MKERKNADRRSFLIIPLRTWMSMACRGIQSVRGSFCRETLQGRAGKRGVFNMRNQPKQIACRTEKHIPMQTVSMHFSQNKNRTS